MAPIAYPAMRLRWCRAALNTFVRRWSVYLLMTAAVVGGGAANAAEVISAATAMVVLPMYAAAAQPAWLAPAMAAYAAVAAMLIWAARSLLWPASWASIERALPILRRDRMRSDMQVVMIALIPVALLYAAGAWALHGRHAAWPLGTAGLLLVALLSVGLGVAVLQGLRQPRPRWLDRWAIRHGRPPDPIRSRRAAFGLSVGRVRWWWVLCLVPLWRGPARRSGVVVVVGMLAPLALVAGLALWPGAAAWWLAGQATGMLLITTRLNRLARDELASLTRQFTALPIPPAWPRRAIALLGMTPALVMTTLVATAASLQLPATALRPGLLAAYCTACLVGCAVEVSSGRHDPATKSMRWMFSWVVMLAFASEVVST